jgi:hypothetical protein
MSPTLIAIAAGAIALALLAAFAFRRAIRALRRFVRAFWPHS